MSIGWRKALRERRIYFLRNTTIWNINSFAQWDVELSKALAQRIIPELESKPPEPRARQFDEQFDPALPKD